MSLRHLAHRAAATTIASVVVLTVAPATLSHASPGAEAEVSRKRAALAPVGYPLQAKSLPTQLSARNKARLPRVTRWASRVLADVMDQPAGLTSVQQVSALHVRRIFRKRLGGGAAAAALRIAWRESRLLPNVVNTKNPNKTNDWGLFQLNDGGTLQHVGGRPGARALRPKWNARAAARLIREVGWWPWGGMHSA